MTVKCAKCGKRYDWEEHEGVCPGCCMYNRKESAEEIHQKLHKTEDGGYVHRQPYEAGQNGYGAQPRDGRQSSYGTYEAGQSGYEQESIDKKSKRMRNLLFAGIVAAMILPHAIAMGAAGISEAIKNSAPKPEKKDVPIVQVSQGSAFCLQEEQEINVAVAEAVTVAEADTLEGTPEGEKLVAVHMSSQIPMEHQDAIYDNEYYPTDDYYIKSGSMFKDAVNIYRIEEVMPEIGDAYPEFGYYSLHHDSDGYVFFFVPEDATELMVYVEMRSTKTGEVEKIYEIPVKIEEA